MARPGVCLRLTVAAAALQVAAGFMPAYPNMCPQSREKALRLQSRPFLDKRHGVVPRFRRKKATSASNIAEGAELVASDEAVGLEESAATADAAGENVAAPPLPALWPASTRIAVGLLASAGAAETSFLSYQKLFSPEGIAAICGVGGGCNQVLSGPYSSLLGLVPLTVLAMGAYAAAAALALVPLAARGRGTTEQAKQADVDLDQLTRTWILGLTTAMATFSAYLMGLLAFRIGAGCPWCITSAAISWTMCLVAWAKQAVPNKTKAAVLGACTVLATALGSGALFLVTEATMGVGEVQAMAQLQSPPVVTTSSSKEALRLAKKLGALDARMYGAYWCSHCFHQKEMFGAEAFKKYIKYVECSERGVNSQYEMCRMKDVPGYPTWEIKGQLYPGEKTLEELQALVDSLR